MHHSKDQVYTFIMMLIFSRCIVSINNYSMLYMVHSIPLAFLELGICSISAILESYICFRNFYTLKK